MTICHVFEVRIDDLNHDAGWRLGVSSVLLKKATLASENRPTKQTAYKDFSQNKTNIVFRRKKISVLPVAVRP